MSGEGQVRVTIRRHAGGEARDDRDVVAAEEPLEIRLRAGGEERPVAITMRTPGADEELAAGFLFAEGVIGDPAEVVAVHRPSEAAHDAAGVGGGGGGGENDENRVVVELAADRLPDLARLERHFVATSACGVCGKAGLDALLGAGHRPLPRGLTVSAATVVALPAALRREQDLFRATGGLHAAALFTAAGELVALREDVGRHNALDKLLGAAFLAGRTPLADSLVLVSGRSSYEIVQKCLAAGVPVVASVSAPSSLAVELAEAFRVTLVGFLRGEGFNVYAAAERIVL